jgi:hypothetical protein
MNSLRDFDDNPLYVFASITADIYTFDLFRSFMDRVKDGAIKIKSAQFPAFIYSSATPYDPRNRSCGLLRGEVLLRVCAGFAWNESWRH